MRPLDDSPNHSHVKVASVQCVGQARSRTAKSQVIVVSHNPILVGELESDEICVPIRLEKDDGETVLQGGDLLSQFGWKWPSR